MSFFPPEFDPRAEVVAVLDLVMIDTPDGPARFLLGVDGRFRDIDGDDWWGCTLISGTDLEMSIGGTAPSGSLTLSFEQDDLSDVLVSEVRALGQAYVDGRAITFLVQPLTAMEEFWAPLLAPITVAVRTARGVTFSAAGAQQRALTLSFEGPAAGRNEARGWTYCTTDHALLTGAANPSLELMPTDLWQEQKLFG